MDSETTFLSARILHVIGVVLWIGGVAFIAAVVLPVLRRMPDSEQGLALFAAVEGLSSDRPRLLPS